MHITSVDTVLDVLIRLAHDPDRIVSESVQSIVDRGSSVLDRIRTDDVTSMTSNISNTPSQDSGIASLIQGAAAIVIHHRRGRKRRTKISSHDIDVPRMIEMGQQSCDCGRPRFDCDLNSVFVIVTILDPDLARCCSTDCFSSVTVYFCDRILTNQLDSHMQNSYMPDTIYPESGRHVYYFG